MFLPFTVLFVSLAPCAAAVEKYQICPTRIALA